MKTINELKEELKYWKDRLYSSEVQSKEFTTAQSECVRVQRLILEAYCSGEAIKKQKLNIGNYYPVVNQSLFARIIRFIKSYSLLILITICSLSCSEEGFDPCNASADAVKMHYRNMELATDPVEKEKHKQRYLTEKHFLDQCRKGN